MSGFDIAILGLMGAFVAMGALRGTIRELISMSVWVVAIFCGWLFVDPIATWFDAFEDIETRRLIAFVAVFLTTFFALSVAAFLVRILMPRPVPDMKSRVVGGAIGCFRGAAVVVALVLLAGLTSLPKKESWQGSSLVAVFMPAARQMLEWLPSPVARQFRYS